jgi:hypothetical protein
MEKNSLNGDQGEFKKGKFVKEIMQKKKKKINSIKYYRQKWKQNTYGRY